MNPGSLVATPVPTNIPSVQASQAPTGVPNEIPTPEVVPSETPTPPPASAGLPPAYANLTSNGQYLNPVGSPIRTFNAIPIMPQATAGLISELCWITLIA